METILQGTDGSEEIIVNNVGKELETVEGSLVEPKQGNNVYLSIDYDLQIAVYKNSGTENCRHSETVSE